MKVLVIGATGLTGRIAVRKLIEQHHEVTAMVRKTSPALVENERFKAVHGEARDPATIELAVLGKDAVLSAFGPRSIRKDDLQEAFMRNLVTAMQRTHVRRLVNLSAWGAGDSYPNLVLPGRLILRTLMRSFFDDKNRGEAILLASDLDFVNVRPGRLSNRAARGHVRASLDPDKVDPLPFMTREDLAAFMVAQLTSDTWLRKSPLIGY